MIDAILDRLAVYWHCFSMLAHDADYAVSEPVDFSSS